MIRSVFFSLLLFYSVWVLSQSNNVQEALQNYQYNEVLILLESEPSTLENLQLKAYCYEKLYNYTSALEIYKQLREQYPDDANLAIGMAECAAQAGNSQLSVQCWLAADSLSPGNQFIRTRKVMAYYRNSNWKETISQAKTVFEVDSVPMLMRMVGDAFLYSFEGDSAIWYYARTTRRNPSDYLAISKLANIYISAKFFDSAIDLTQQFLENINPDHQQIGLLNGMAHYSAANYKEATDRLRNNVILGDSSYTTCYYLGMSLYASKLYYEATTWLEKAYNQANGSNRDIRLLYYYGTALSWTYNRKRGIEVLAEGVSIIEEMNEMLFDFDNSFGDAYMRSSNYPKAIEYYQSAYKRDTDSHSLLYNIGYCYELNKDYKNAITYYERFLKTAPKELKLDEEVDSERGKVNSTEQLYKHVAWRLAKMKEEQFFN